jgi:SAM-dependent methyltransferase
MNDKELKFTGERLVPGLVDESLWYEHIARYVFASQFVQDKTLLDAGCGTGYGANFLVSRGAKNVEAIDISIEGLSYAKKNYSTSNTHYKVMDITALGYKENSFDIVTSFEVIEHITEQEIFISEVARVLKPEGVLIISTPNKGVYRSGLAHNPYHVRELTLIEFKDLLSRFFENVNILSQNFFWGVELASLENDLKSQASSTIDQSLYPERKQPSYLLAVCSNASSSVENSYRLLTQISDTSAEYLTKLQAEFEDRTEWALKLNNEIEETRQQNLHLLNEIKDKAQEIADLQALNNENLKRMDHLIDDSQVKSQKIAELSAEVRGGQGFSTRKWGKLR